MNDHSKVQLRNYSPMEPFKKDDKVKHVQFGEGIVQKIVPPNKMEVLFKYDIKLLICKGERST